VAHQAADAWRGVCGAAAAVDGALQLGGLVLLHAAPQLQQLLLRVRRAGLAACGARSKNVTKPFLPPLTSPPTGSGRTPLWTCSDDKTSRH